MYDKLLMRSAKEEFSKPTLLVLLLALSFLPLTTIDIEYRYTHLTTYSSSNPCLKLGHYGKLLGVL